MFVYEKKLQYPIRIKNPNPQLAKIIISQYGGPDGELGASLRYLSQRFTMPYPELKGLLTDIGRLSSQRLSCSENMHFEAFLTENAHLKVSKFRYTSTWSLSTITTLSKIF